MRRPNVLSVTDAPCPCGLLDRNARDRHFPLRFDAKYDEYYLDLILPKGTKFSLLVNHCPMCGGVASESKRRDAFTVVTGQEAARVHALIRAVKTVEEIIGKFGRPERDSTYQLPEDIPTPRIPGTDLQQIGPLRQLIYEHLSETAEVQFTVYSNGKVERLISAKYIGLPRRRQKVGSPKR
jgi:hypothetical protein